MNGQTLSLRRRVYNRGMRALVWLCAGLTCALLVFLIGYIFCRGIPGLTWELLSGQTSYIKNTIGILPNILNTLYIILVAMVIVLPLGVGAAIYLTEYAENRRLVSLIEFAAETLTGIPSIIFGLVGMLFFVQKMNLQAGVLAGGLTLVVMILPTILRTTQESLKTVSSLSNSAVKTIRDTQSLVTDTENLMKSTGSTLDDGTKQTLEGLAAVLRSTAKTMSTAGQIKDAKSSICDIIEDTWDE